MMNGKVVKAVRACDEVTYFRNKAYNAWKALDGKTSKAHYVGKFLRFAAYKFSFPGLIKSRREARLKFVEPVSIHFDSYPECLYYEIIPMIWDCWPQFDDKVCRWIKIHKIKTCIFTCRQAAERIQSRFPNLNVLVLHEGLNTDWYKPGLELCKRDVDLYTYGRISESLLKMDFPGLKTERGGNFKTLLKMLQNSKVTVALPRCDVFPKETGGQETLTQRYWECMLSRIVMIGRSPKELTDLIGYDPVIPVDYEHYSEQVRDIVTHIEDYQELVDKNRETALRMAPWELRMKQLMEWLTTLGYEI